jgi:hypothetical protein
MNTVDAVEALLKKLSAFDSNEEFLDNLGGNGNGNGNGNGR